jgi:hypothetical protein
LKGKNLSRARISFSGQIGTFRVLLLLVDFRRLGVILMGLLGYEEEKDGWKSGPGGV